jgi:hypothetical protein
MSFFSAGHFSFHLQGCLTAEERAELDALKQKARVTRIDSPSWKAREEACAFLAKARVLELAHLGEGVTRISRRMDCHKEQVRRVLRGYLQKGLAALAAKPGRPVDVQGRVEILASMDLFEEQVSPASSKELWRLVNLRLKSPLSYSQFGRYLREFRTLNSKPTR